MARNEGYKIHETGYNSKLFSGVSDVHACSMTTAVNFITRYSILQCTVYDGLTRM